MSSIEFLYFFLPAFLGLYAVVPARHKAKIMILGELVFIASASVYGLIPAAASMFMAYLSGIDIDNHRNGPKGKKVRLIFAVTVEIVIFIAFNLLSVTNATNGSTLLGNLSVLKLFSAVGVSVYPLHCISYCVDIYRGKYRCDHRFSIVAAYVGFLPSLTVGPIVRFDEIKERLLSPKITSDKLAGGVSLFLKGLAEKVVLSYLMLEMWTQVKAISFSELSTVTSWLGILAFGMHLYFEFAGFSHMARGISSMLGIELPMNFDYPYMATSMLDYINKFNSSVTGWFRDYVYKPLGAEGNNKCVMVFNTFLAVMLLLLWYGFSENVLLWGLYLAVWIILDKLFLNKMFARLPSVLSTIITVVLLMFGWSLAGLTNLSSSLEYLKAMLGMNKSFGDSTAIYFIKSYLPVLILCILITTKAFAHVISKLEKHKYNILTFAQPLYQLALLIVSTAFMYGMDVSVLSFGF